MEVVEKKRRGPRKTKILDNKDLKSSNTVNDSSFVEVKSDDNNKQVDNIIIKSETICSENPNISEENTKIPKKRGRKPKGGKIITENNNNLGDSSLQVMPNIILHLKCKMSDLDKYNSSLLTNNDTTNKEDEECNEYVSLSSNTCTDIPGLDTYEQFGKTTKTTELGYYVIDAPAKSQNKDYYASNTIESSINYHSNNYNEIKMNDINTYENDMNNVWKKLKDLEVQLHKNDISDKRSACFWDTCEFDTPPVYIPRVQLDNNYHVYGCFCSPECAVAYLLKENIDAASRFERLHLLNHMYGKICNYERSIKPAPDPYYTLDKYYGNLTIQEYRKLLKSERLLLVVDLPLTRELPEIHLDNGDYLIGGQSIPTTGKYKVKKVSQKNTKANIMQERFGSSK